MNFSFICSSVLNKIKYWPTTRVDASDCTLSFKICGRMTVVKINTVQKDICWFGYQISLILAFLSYNSNEGRYLAKCLCFLIRTNMKHIYQIRLFSFVCKRKQTVYVVYLLVFGDHFSSIAHN